MEVKLDPRYSILIEGARVHNLRNISVAIPRNRLVVVTGLSGSGKSSLAFDTLYAEGQRRYVESLSSYARQFLGRMDKPEVDNIRGIAPAIAIDQKVISRNARSTVGTSTEIYDYLKLLYARIGQTFSPVSGAEVKRHRASDIFSFVSAWPEGERFYILAPVAERKDRSLKKHLEIIQQQGFSRVMSGQEVIAIEEAVGKSIEYGDGLFIVIDRLVVSRNDTDFEARVVDSAESAFYEGGGECRVMTLDGGKSAGFSNRFEIDGMAFEEPSVHFFSFNNPVGACKTCEGFGSVIGIDENLVIPDKGLSVYQDAIAPWKGEKMSEWKMELISHAAEFGFPVHKAYRDLTAEQKELLWSGNRRFSGLRNFFAYLEEKSYKIQYRVMLSRYRGKTVCPDCRGTRLRKDAGYVKIGGKSISDLVLMPISQLRPFFVGIELDNYRAVVAKRLLLEISNRLQFLDEVGLGYLTLNRLSNSLSGGESQRINLATSLGSSLVGSMYILDEPSIGLHPRDTAKLIGVLRRLQQLGNTVIVVEHDEEMMKAADHIIDLGPLAGSGGGKIVFEGNFSELPLAVDSLTSDYLTGKKSLPIPPLPRKWKDRIILKGVRQHNLKNITVEIPLHTLTAVTGVSGSGKSTLVRDILYPALRRHLEEYAEHSGEFDSLSGDVQSIKAVEYVDQNPIGKSSRSNPVTYVKAYDEIRALFSEAPASVARGFKPSHFSFNVPGGRCEQCEGEGEVTIEMQFMADIRLTCEVCKGKRFKEEVLDVEIHGRNIHQVLELTVTDALEFFGSFKKSSTAKRLIDKLMPLYNVGLGYITLGQSSNTLSGGEAQRIKLASFLAKGKNQAHTLFIFDEPTTGLHFHDVNQLMDAFNALIGAGHSILVIEHDMDVIKCADWVIDLGPEGGEEGGNIVCVGTPSQVASCATSYTGRFLRAKYN